MTRNYKNVKEVTTTEAAILLGLTVDEVRKVAKKQNIAKKKRGRYWLPKKWVTDNKLRSKFANEFCGRSTVEEKPKQKANTVKIQAKTKKSSSPVDEITQKLNEVYQKYKGTDLFAGEWEKSTYVRMHTELDEFLRKYKAQNLLDFAVSANIPLGKRPSKGRIKSAISDFLHEKVKESAPKKARGAKKTAPEKINDTARMVEKVYSIIYPHLDEFEYRKIPYYYKKAVDKGVDITPGYFNDVLMYLERQGLVTLVEWNRSQEKMEDYKHVIYRKYYYFFVKKGKKTKERMKIGRRINDTLKMEKLVKKTLVPLLDKYEYKKIPDLYKGIRESGIDITPGYFNDILMLLERKGVLVIGEWNRSQEKMEDYPHVIYRKYYYFFVKKGKGTTPTRINDTAKMVEKVYSIIYPHLDKTEYKKNSYLYEVLRKKGVDITPRYLGDILWMLANENLVHLGEWDRNKETIDDYPFVIFRERLYDSARKGAETKTRENVSRRINDTSKMIQKVKSLLIPILDESFYKDIPLLYKKLRGNGVDITPGYFNDIILHLSGKGVVAIGDHNHTQKEVDRQHVLFTGHQYYSVKKGKNA